MKPLQTRRGLVFIESRYLSPVSDILDVLELYERITPGGTPYIVAKAGFLLQAVIMPYDVISQQFVDNLKRLTEQCVLSLDLRERKKALAHAAEPEQYSLNVDPTCGWEAAEAERRRAYLREHGLTLCADGLRRLIIPKNGGNEEMKYKVCDHCGAHLDNGETCDCRNTNNDGGEPKDKQKERKNDNDGN